MGLLELKSCILPTLRFTLHQSNWIMDDEQYTANVRLGWSQLPSPGPDHMYDDSAEC
jgi:hypothetical protein